VSPENIVTIIVAVLSCAATLAVGFWTRLGKKEDRPIVKRDADLAVAKTAQEMSLELAQELRQDVIRLRTDLTTEQEHRQKLAEDVKSLRAKLRELDGTVARLQALLQVFRDAWDDLINRWPEIRLQEEPPPNPELKNED